MKNTMKTKHTQGEWRIIKTYIHPDREINKVAKIAFGNDEDNECLVYSRSLKELEANSQLIELAPELLQILSEIVTPHGFNTQSSLKERALNIIAKATL